MVEELIKLADELDSLGYHKEAGKIDEYIKKIYNNSSRYTKSIEEVFENHKFFEESSDD